MCMRFRFEPLRWRVRGSGCPRPETVVRTFVRTTVHLATLRKICLTVSMDVKRSAIQMTLGSLESEVIRSLIARVCGDAAILKNL